LGFFFKKNVFLTLARANMEV